MNKLFVRLTPLLATILLAAGCSSGAEKQRQLEMVASSRANLLASNLPIERGPLSIMRANAYGSTIEIMMIYNEDAPTAKPTRQLLQASLNQYCSSDDIKNALEVGVTYRLKIRNSRGQLIIDQVVDQNACK
ncbi:GspS/AspS pilotin family protein [Vibrio sp.]|uniref:GspS/AspS pilotin family protein n=1 Tax=Vibrio sp. TaxID=678 RepID=UPI003D11E029